MGRMISRSAPLQTDPWVGASLISVPEERMGDLSMGGGRRRTESSRKGESSSVFSAVDLDIFKMRKQSGQWKTDLVIYPARSNRDGMLISTSIHIRPCVVINVESKPRICDDLPIINDGSFQSLVIPDSLVIGINSCTRFCIRRSPQPPSLHV